MSPKPKKPASGWKIPELEIGGIQRKPYRRFDLDLSIARTGEQFDEVGSFIFVEECDGDVYVKLNDNQAAFFKLDEGRFYKSEYNQFWIKNTAQAGKSLKALIGDPSFFRVDLEGVRSHIKLKDVLADQHSDTKVRTKEVDETNIGNRRILAYDTASGKLKYINRWTIVVPEGEYVVFTDEVSGEIAAFGYGDIGFHYVTIFDLLHVRNADCEIINIGKGVVIKSPDGTRYRIIVANDGTLSTEAA